MESRSELGKNTGKNMVEMKSPSELFWELNPTDFPADMRDNIAQTLMEYKQSYEAQNGLEPKSLSLREALFVAVISPVRKFFSWMDSTSS